MKGLEKAQSKRGKAAGKRGKKPAKVAISPPEPQAKLHFLGHDPELDQPAAPGHLSDEAQEQWDALLAEFALTDQSLLVLMTTLESFDRMRQAQGQLAMEGNTYLDRFGQPKAHPATLIERDSRSAYCRGLKDLGLNLEPVRSGPGRPPGS